MLTRFLVLDHGDPRPPAARIIFCDGSGGSLFREETDLELSHWRPNRTPAAYRAGTSTEICFRFLDSPIAGDWTLAVNNHLDIDGILSVYTLLHGAHAQAHRRTIIEAAEMGDFWSWGEPPAQRLFQGLTRLMNIRSRAERPAQSIYEEAFDRAPALIDGRDPESGAIEESLAPLRRGVALVEEGTIRRRQLTDRFSHYTLPESFINGAIDRAVYVPAFNEAISPNAILWPEARAKWDRQRICLVSAESADGWFHDLWAPGYLWADTENHWTVPGLRYNNGMQNYVLANAELLRAVDELQREELENRQGATGKWAMGNEGSPFCKQIQNMFPVILRFVSPEFRAAPSSLAPEKVATKLARCFP